MEKLQDKIEKDVCKECRLGKLNPKKVDLVYSVGFHAPKNNLTISTLQCPVCANVVINDCHTELMRKKV